MRTSGNSARGEKDTIHGFLNLRREKQGAAFWLSSVTVKPESDYRENETIITEDFLQFRAKTESPLGRVERGQGRLGEEGRVGATKRRGRRAEERSQGNVDRQAGVDSTSGAQPLQLPGGCSVPSFQCSQAGGCVPPGTGGNVWGPFREVLLPSMGRRPRTLLLTIPQCTGRPPPNKGAFSRAMLTLLTWGNHALLYL